LVNSEQLEPRRRIIWRRRAGAVDRVGRLRPFLLGDVGVSEAEKGGNLVGVFCQQTVVERSCLVRTACCSINLRYTARRNGEVRIDRESGVESAFRGGIIVLSNADYPQQRVVDRVFAIAVDQRGGDVRRLFKVP